MSARQIVSEMFPPQPAWTAKDMPSQKGKVAIVTGGNSGVGYETVLALIQHGARVYMASRSEQRAAEAIAKLRQKTANDESAGEVRFLKCDLGELASVRRAADEFLSQETELHMLFNNAGVMAPPEGSKTADGYELQLGTNVLAHQFFTKLLLPTLLATARSASVPNSVRVVFTSSIGHHLGPNGFDPKDPARQKDRMTSVGAVGRWWLYGQSKLGDILLANKLHRMHGNDGVVFTSVNPGNLRTELARHTNPFETIMFSLIIRPFILFPQWYGPLSQLYAATAPEAGSLGGKYFVPWARSGETRPVAQDVRVQDDLWNWCEEQTARVK